MALFPTLRAFAVGAQNPIARRQWLAGRYLRLLGLVSKRMRDGMFKSRLVNLLRSVPWQDMRLPEQLVSVASDIRFRIVPHVGEFDFDALFYTALRYENEVFAVLRRRMSQYDVVVEIGANVGIYTVFFAKAFTEVCGRGHVFAFEPSQKAFRRLCENVTSNDLSNVSAFNCAVGSSTGLVQFFEPEGHLTNGSLKRDFAELFSDRVDHKLVMAVDGELVDGLVPEDRRLLLKIDVEGSESEVLRALERFILKRRPEIVLEVLPDGASDLNAIDFIRANYRSFNITTGGLVEKDRFEPDARFRDYLLLPKLETYQASVD
jgi:FkbM family methyltransferase